MKKFLNKKVGVIVGTAVLATGLLAIPALADTQTNQNANIFGKMQSFMSQTFAPGQHQQVMNSPAMQNLHNSAAMQKAMQTGDVNQMQNLMNSDPQVKAQLGQETLDKMNQFMNENKDQLGQAMSSQNRGAMNQYMKGNSQSHMNTQANVNGQAVQNVRQSAGNVSAMMGSFNNR